jgi:hypothetical protein
MFVYITAREDSIDDYLARIDSKQNPQTPDSNLSLRPTVHYMIGSLNWVCQRLKQPFVDPPLRVIVQSPQITGRLLTKLEFRGRIAQKSRSITSNSPR